MAVASALKRKADFLTALRLLGVFMIPLTWFIQGPASVSGLGGWLLLAFWITDLFDGRLARQSGLAGEGFWGKNDHPIDVMFLLSSLTLLGLGNFISPEVYLLVSAAILGLCRLDFQLFQPLAVFFVTLFYFWAAFTQNPFFGVGIGLFLVMHAIFSREGFGQRVRQFFRHLPKFLGGQNEQSYH